MITELKPQTAQETFLKSRADIAIFGGAAGGGKSFSLLLEPLYHADNGEFRAAIFRRTAPMLRQPGGLWDISTKVYGPLHADPRESSLEWKFKSGAAIKFASMEHETDRFNFQGLQVSFLAFDELCQFTADQFWYLLSRLRSTSGIKGYVRCGCNPDPDSFVRNLIDWWIDPATGLPIRDRSGVLRWFVRIGDELQWSDTKRELLEKFGRDSDPKSLTFIPSRVFDNRILLDSDPSYLSNLKALPYIDRARLLDGNWNVRATGGNYFRRSWFEIVDAPPKQILARVRYWDRAATEKTASNDPDATVGLLLSVDKKGIYYVEDVQRLFASPHRVEQAMKNCATQDGNGTIIGFMQDPGSAGVQEAQSTARALDGYCVRFATATGDKETRAKPTSAQAEAGNVKIVRASWNDGFLRELENFPGGRHDDSVDALSGAHGILRTAPLIGFRPVDLPSRFTRAIASRRKRELIGY